jgi:hypothetical protein
MPILALLPSATIRPFPASPSRPQLASWVALPGPRESSPAADKMTPLSAGAALSDWLSPAVSYDCVEMF